MGGNNPNLLNPPEQFGIVEPGIYRSDMLQQPHFTYLKQFGFKTLIMLSPELPNRVTSNFIEEGDIKLVHVGMATWKPTQPSTWRPVSEELIKEGLELILDVETHPILIMCTYVKLCFLFKSYTVVNRLFIVLVFTKPVLWWAA